MICYLFGRPRGRLYTCTRNDKPTDKVVFGTQSAQWDTISLVKRVLYIFFECILCLLLPLAAYNWQCKWIIRKKGILLSKIKQDGREWTIDWNSNYYFKKWVIYIYDFIHSARKNNMASGNVSDCISIFICKYMYSICSFCVLFF